MKPRIIINFGRYKLKRKKEVSLKREICMIRKGAQGETSNIVRWGSKKRKSTPRGENRYPMLSM